MKNDNITILLILRHTRLAVTPSAPRWDYQPCRDTACSAVILNLDWYPFYAVKPKPIACSVSSVTCLVTTIMYLMSCGDVMTPVMWLVWQEDPLTQKQFNVLVPVEHATLYSWWHLTLAWWHSCVTHQQVFTWWHMTYSGIYCSKVAYYCNKNMFPFEQ